MNLSAIVYLALGAATCLFFGLFALTSLREVRPRAVNISIAVAIGFGILWFGWYIVFSPPAIALWVISAILAFFALAFFLPISKPKSMRIDEITERVDERDIMFSREEYKPGSEKYITYYAMRPAYKDIDDKLRSLPELLAPGGKYYDPLRSRHTDSIFHVIERLTREVDGPHSDTKSERDPEQMTTLIKSLCRSLGADDVGVAKVNPKFVYSHVGRGPEPWGTPIATTHTHAVMFTLEMNYENVEAAPTIPITEESAREYLKGALISITMAQYIRDLGYPARAHIAGSNYQIMMPPVAYDAGLGELGRHGYLISPTLGSRVRLGGVTTEMPLVPDRPITFGVQEFCERCKRCADNCPSGSIPSGAVTQVRGVWKWPLQVESCIRYWRLIGTDCGLCMKVCPYSHPRAFVHSVVRSAIKRSAIARRMSIIGEDLFYGRKAEC